MTYNIQYWLLQEAFQISSWKLQNQFLLDIGLRAVFRCSIFNYFSSIQIHFLPYPVKRKCENLTIARESGIWTWRNRYKPEMLWQFFSFLVSRNQLDWKFLFYLLKTSRKKLWDESIWQWSRLHTKLSTQTQNSLSEWDSKKLDYWIRIEFSMCLNSKLKGSSKLKV